MFSVVSSKNRTRYLFYLNDNYSTFYGTPSKPTLLVHKPTYKVHILWTMCILTSATHPTIYKLGSPDSSLVPTTDSFPNCDHLLSQITQILTQIMIV